MSNALPVAKLAVQVVSGLGVSKIVNDIIRNQVVIASTADVVKVWVGSLVISSIIVEQSSNHIDRAANEVAGWFANRKTEESSSNSSS